MLKLRRTFVTLSENPLAQGRITKPRWSVSLISRCLLRWRPLRMIFVCLFFEVSTDQGYQFFLPWRPKLHTKAHKIQLLTYSSNVQRAVEFKLLLKGKVKTLQHSDYTCNGFAPIFTFDDVMSPSRSLFHLRFVFWWFRPSHHATRKLDDSPQHRNISCNVKQFNVQLELLMFWKAILHHLFVRCTTRHYAQPFHATLHCLYVRCTVVHYAEPFHETLHRLCERCAIRHYPEPFHATLHRLYVRYAIRHYAKPFHATLHHMCVLCTIRHYAELFDAMLHRLCTVLQVSANLFTIELFHITISCSNST